MLLNVDICIHDVAPHLLFCSVEQSPVTICWSASVSARTCTICLSVVWLSSLLTLFSSLITVFSASTTALSSAGIGDSLLEAASVFVSSAARSVEIRMLSMQYSILILSEAYDFN